MQTLQTSRDIVYRRIFTSCLEISNPLRRKLTNICISIIEFDNGIYRHIEHAYQIGCHVTHVEQTSNIKNKVSYKKIHISFFYPFHL